MQIRLSAASTATSRLRVPFEAPPGVLRLDRNEDPLGWPQGLLDGFINTIDSSDLAAYPDTTELRTVIATELSMRNDNVWVAAGCDEIISLTFRTYCEAGDLVLTLSPTYGMYEVNAMSTGTRIKTVRDSLDSAAITEQIMDHITSDSPALVTLASPNQPTGTEFSVDQLSCMAEGASLYGGVLLVDEAYYGFGSTSALELLQRFDNVIIGRTFSKAFGLAGLRVGYAVADAQRIEELSRLAPLCESTRMGLSAALYVLKHRSEHQEHVEDLIGGREALASTLLESLGNRILSPRANFVVVAVPTVHHGEEVVATLLERGIAVRLVPDAGPLGPAIRITSPGLQRAKPIASAVIQAIRDCRAHI